MRISDWSSEVCSSDLTVDYTANVETATWAALQQCEVATSCTMCHTNQTKCDNCHTRHQFSVVEARKPQACATCHNGVDHNEYERSEEHTSELQSLMRISYAVFCLKKTNTNYTH